MIKKKFSLEVSIQRAIRDDLEPMFAIEDTCSKTPWGEAKFFQCFRDDCTTLVAKTTGGLVVGFMVYESHQTRFHVLNFAVHADYRRRGVGTQMVDWLIRGLDRTRCCITIEVRETSLDAQKFWSDQGFWAIGVRRDYYKDKDKPEDAYVMHYPSPGTLKLWQSQRTAS